MTHLPARALERIGGRLCLDFVNTAAWAGMTCLCDHVTNYADLVGWGRHVGILTPERAAGLAGHGSAATGRTLRQVLTFREISRRLLLPQASLAPADFITLGNALARWAPILRPLAADRQAAYAGPDDPAGWVIGPIAVSLTELLTSPELHAVRACPGERCGRLFIDRTRNHSRIWCSMNNCGNRAKARAHYIRRRQGG